MLFIVEKDGKIRESDTSAHLHVFIAIKYQSQKLDYILTTFWTHSASFSLSVFILCRHVADRQCELPMYSKAVQLRMDMPLGEPKLGKACPLKGQAQASNHCSIPPKPFPELQDGEREATGLEKQTCSGKGRCMQPGADGFSLCQEVVCRELPGLRGVCLRPSPSPPGG